MLVKLEFFIHFRIYHFGNCNTNNPCCGGSHHTTYCCQMQVTFVYNLAQILCLTTFELCCTVFSIILDSNLMFCSVWYHLYSLENVKNTKRVVLLLLKLKAEKLSHVLT